MAKAKLCDKILCCASGLIFIMMCLSSFYNLSQLTNEHYKYSIHISSEAVNYHLGVLVQSALVGIFCVIAIIHEIMALLSKTLLPFMEKDMARAITHLLIGCFSLGFCGGMGIYASIIEMSFAVICYITAIAKAWNPGNGEPVEYDQSTT